MTRLRMPLREASWTPEVSLPMRADGTPGDPPLTEKGRGRKLPRSAERRTPPRRRRLAAKVVAAIDAARVLGIRAGLRSDHRFIGIWAVVVQGRVFARSWTAKRTGWYCTLLEDPLATIRVGEREVRVRAVRIGSERLRDAVESAYAKKYPTPGSRKYVRGFRTPRRRETTVEFVAR